MKFFLKTAILFSVIFIVSCENEVEINDDYHEVTSVFGLLDRHEDTQFVRIGRTFLDNDQNAIQLAGQPDRLYYDSLNVKLNEVNTNNSITLKRIILPKGDGLFTQDRNEVYITTERPTPSAIYELEIIKPDGSVTKGKTKVTGGVSILKPLAATRQPLILIDFRGDFSTYELRFQTANNIGEFEVKLKFKYVEVIPALNDSTFKEFTIPLTKIPNPNLEAVLYKYRLEAFRFFDAFEANIPVSNDAPKRVMLDRNSIEIIVDAADGEYSLYRAVNGPIDGLSQTRTEYTNIENGIGLFASRRKTIVTTEFNDDTRNHIFEEYGNKIDNPSQFRGFAHN